MAIGALRDHPQRHALANELHARPFPELHAPSEAAVMVIRPEGGRDVDRDRALLCALLDREGAPHPPPGADHYSGTLGRHFLKWERHTEVVTYTLYAQETAEPAFSARLFDEFPADWLAGLEGDLVTSILVRIEPLQEQDAPDRAVLDRMRGWFVPESMAISRMIDGQVVGGSDFRIDPAGHVRIGVLARPDIGPRRLGRIVQRLIEIEIYKTLSMLTLPVARQVAGRVAVLDAELTALVGALARGEGEEAATLDRLLAMSAEIEALSSSSAFRFGAAGAYEAIVMQRIAALREQRIEGRQTLAEFMARRYEPAMRTCRSAKARLDELAEHASRAAELLRTRVEVAIAAQNRGLLQSMDRRAALQLRLQETVEGLSVVAISYYAVSLGGYLLAPAARLIGLGKTGLLAALVLPVVLIVWWLARRVRRRLTGGD